jgi:hypothetical protein
MNTTKESKSAKGIYLINIQKFLNFFQKSKEFHKMSDSFKTEPRIFINESQLPDLWLKTRTPFDKNIAFKYYGKRGSSSFQKWKMKNSNVNLKPNYFPNVPLIIPFENELNSRQVQVKTLSVENLFTEKEENIFKIPNDKEKGSAGSLSEIKLDFPGVSANHPKKEDFFQEKFTEKTWNISFFHMNQHIVYGPLGAFKIYIFLKNMYTNLSSAEKTRKNFMIVDIANDVYYQPDTLYEILYEEFEKKKTGAIVNSTTNSHISSHNNIQSITQPVFNYNANDYSNHVLRPVFPGHSHKFNTVNLNLFEKNSDIIRKNSGVSSTTGSNKSNGITESSRYSKYSTGRNKENVIVGLDVKRMRKGKRKSFRRGGEDALACEN